MACLFPPSFPIRDEASADAPVELLDGPLPPLPAPIYPGVNVRPILVRYPSLPHLLTQGGLEDLGLDILKVLIWRQRKVATHGPEGGAARFA